MVGLGRVGGDGSGLEPDIDIRRIKQVQRRMTVFRRFRRVGDDIVGTVVTASGIGGHRVEAAMSLLAVECIEYRVATAAPDRPSRALICTVSTESRCAGGAARKH